MTPQSRADLGADYKLAESGMLKKNFRSEMAELAREIYLRNSVGRGGELTRFVKLVVVWQRGFRHKRQQSSAVNRRAAVVKLAEHAHRHADKIQSFKPGGRLRSVGARSAASSSAEWKNRSEQLYPVTHSSGKSATTAPSSAALCASRMASPMLYSQSATRSGGTASAIFTNPSFIRVYP